MALNSLYIFIYLHQISLIFGHILNLQLQNASVSDLKVIDDDIDDTLLIVSGKFRGTMKMESESLTFDGIEKKYYIGIINDRGIVQRLKNLTKIKGILCGMDNQLAMYAGNDRIYKVPYGADSADEFDIGAEDISTCAAITTGYKSFLVVKPNDKDVLRLIKINWRNGTKDIKQIKLPFNASINNLELTNQQEMIVFSSSNHTAQSEIRAVSFNGDPVWTFKIKNLTVMKIRLDQTGNVYCLLGINSSLFFLSKISPIGQESWKVKLNIYPLDFAISTQNQTEIIGVLGNNKNHNRSFFMIISNSGNLLFKRYIETSSFNIIRFTRLNQVVLGGQINEHESRVVTVNFERSESSYELHSSIGYIYPTISVSLVVLLVGGIISCTKKNKSSLNPKFNTSLVTTGSPQTNSQFKGTFQNVGSTLVEEEEKSFYIPGFLEVEHKVDFKRGDKLARGGDAMVYQCMIIAPELLKRSQLIPTVFKELAPSLELVGSSKRQAFYQELSVMWKLKDYPQFAQILGFCKEPAGLIMKHYMLGDLKKLIYEKDGAAAQYYRYNKRLIINIMLQAAKAVKILHNLGIAHCDIKCGNTLLDFDPKRSLLLVAISDFGISKILNTSELGVSGFKTSKIEGASLFYCPPEAFIRLKSDDIQMPADVYKAGDVYSLAIMFLEMLTRAPPIPCLRIRNRKKGRKF